jgi:hypothetical protein
MYIIGKIYVSAFLEEPFALNLRIEKYQGNGNSCFH